MYRQEYGDSKVLEAYLKDISDLAPVSPKEKAFLAGKAESLIEEDCLEMTEKNSAQIRSIQQTLVESTLTLVIHLAKKYRDQGVPFLDLIQEGNIALVKASRQFRPSSGNLFSTYAGKAIRTSLIEALSKYDRTIRFNRDARRRDRRIQDSVDKLTQQSGREPSLSEISKDTGLSSAGVLAVIDAPKDSLSIDDLEEVILDERALNPLLSAIDNQLLTKVQDLLPKLDDVEQKILRSYFGLEGEETQTLKDMGPQMNVDHRTIWNRKNKALQRLKDQLDLP